MHAFLAGIAGVGATEILDFAETFRRPGEAGRDRARLFLEVDAAFARARRRGRRRRRRRARARALAARLRGRVARARRAGAPQSEPAARGRGPVARAARERVVAKLPRDADAFLRHHAHLLPERGAAPRDGLHHDVRRHAGALPPAGRRGRVLHHRHRRARREDGRGRRRAGHRPAGVRRPHGRSAFASSGARSASSRAASCAPRTPSTCARCSTSGRRIYDKGEIELRDYEGLYCVGCEEFKTERDLVDGKCALHPNRAIESRRERNYFFRTSHYFDWLTAELRANPSLIEPERYRNEVLAMLRDGGVGDLCISRPVERLTWGIPLPFDDALRRVRVGRCADHVPVRGRLSGRPGVDSSAWSGVAPPDREGHPEVPRRAVADHAARGGHSAVPGPARARLLHARRTEDLEERGEHESTRSR